MEQFGELYTLMIMNMGKTIRLDNYQICFYDSNILQCFIYNSNNSGLKMIYKQDVFEVYTVIDGETLNCKIGDFTCNDSIKDKLMGKIMPDLIYELNTYKNS